MSTLLPLNSSNILSNLRYSLKYKPLKTTILLTTTLTLITLTTYSLLNTVNTSALTTTPEVETAISIHQDGIEATDATVYDVATGTNPGTDDSDQNNLVKNLDSIVYKVEVSLNENDDTGVVSTVKLDDSAEWNAIPGNCIDRGVSGVNLSYLDDSNADGLNDTLVCALVDSAAGEVGDEGTKWVYYASARAKGTNTPVGSTDYTNDPNLASNADCATTTVGVASASLDLNASSCIEVVAEATSDNANPATSAPDTSNVLQTYITATFGVTTNKNVNGLPDSSEVADPATDPNEGDYSPTYNVLGPNGVDTGVVVKWHLSANYVPGSEIVDPSIAAYTITDIFDATHSIGSTNVGDGGILLYNWDPAFTPCDSLNGNGTVTCTQPAVPGPQFDIQITGLDTTDPTNSGNLFSLYVLMWIPDSTLDTTATTATEALIIENEFEITDVDGSPDLTSVTGLANQAANELSDEDYFLRETPPPGTYSFLKTFAGVSPSIASSFGKLDDIAGAPGDRVLTGLYSSSSLPNDHEALMCDKIDTVNFTFDGLPSAPYQTILRKQGQQVPASSAWQWAAPFEGYREVGYSPAFVNILNGNGGAGGSAPIGTPDQYVDADFPNPVFEILYSDTPHNVGSGGGTIATATCDDDVNGDGTVNIDTGAADDWVTNPATLPGGTTSVTKIRVKYDRKLADVTATPAFALGGNINTVFMFHFYLKINAGAAPGDFLPNYAVDKIDVNDPVWRGDGVSEDPADPFFAVDLNHAHRIKVLPAVISIDKQTINPELRSGELVGFTLTPQFNGVTTPQTVTIYDNIPAGTVYSSDDCAVVYPGCTLVTSTFPTIRWDIPGVSPGDLGLPITLYLDTDGLDSGNYRNQTIVTVPDATIMAASNNRVDYSNFVILPNQRYNISKNIDKYIEEVSTDDQAASPSILNNHTYTLNWDNTGNEDFEAGEYIDILPFFGDTDTTLYADGHTTQFANRDGDYYNPNDLNADGYTDPADPLEHEPTPVGPSDFNEHYAQPVFTSVGLDPANPIVAPAWATIEYSTDDPTTIPNNPCDSANQAAVPGVGDPCYLQYILNGNAFIDGSPAPTTTVAWGPAPANLKDVTAIRIVTTPHTDTEGVRTLDVTVQPHYNLEDDVYCNNFSGYTADVSLDLISNDVCHKVVAATLGNYVWMDDGADGVQEPAATNGLPDIDVKLLIEDPANPGSYIPFMVPDPANPGSFIAYEVDTSDGTDTYVDQETGTTVTLAKGEYIFQNLPSGNFRVMVDNTDTDLPVGAIPTWDSDNTTANNGTQDHMSNHTIAALTNNTDPTADLTDNDQQDFGYAVPDLALTKTLSTAAEDVTLVPGDTVDFTMTVTNQGSIPAYNVDVTDYIPAGFELAAADQGSWTTAGTGPLTTTQTITGPIAAYDGTTYSTATVTITLTVLPTAINGAFLANDAEISAAYNDAASTTLLGDIDSTADTTNGNDAGGNDSNPTDGPSDADDYINGNGTGASGDGVDTTDEDDHDSEDVLVQWGSIGDTVWYDEDVDGIEDGGNEVPLQGVVVNLLDASGNPVLDSANNPVTATTDASGMYLFDYLPFDTYRVAIDTTTLPANHLPTYDQDNGTNTPDHMSITTIDTTTPDDQDQDFGYTQSAELSGHAWFDDDNGQDIDSSEAWIPNTTVELLDTNGNVLGVTTTDSNGYYEFTGLLPGDYQVRITPPADHTQIYDNDGTTTTSLIQNITLTAGDNLTNQDFGYINAETLDQLQQAEDLAETGTTTAYLTVLVGTTLAIAATTLIKQKNLSLK